MAIKQNDKIKTRRGVDVEIIYVFPEGQTDVHGDVIIGILTEEGESEIWGWSRDGRFRSLKNGPSGLDLVIP